MFYYLKITLVNKQYGAEIFQMPDPDGTKTHGSVTLPTSTKVFIYLQGDHKNIACFSNAFKKKIKHGN